MELEFRFLPDSQEDRDITCALFCSVLYIMEQVLFDEILILSVEENPRVYDKRRVSYKDEKMKENTWLSITASLNTDRYECFFVVNAISFLYLVENLLIIELMSLVFIYVKGYLLYISSLGNSNSPCCGFRQTHRRETLCNVRVQYVGFIWNTAIVELFFNIFPTGTETYSSYHGIGREVQTAIKRWFRSQAADFYDTRIQKLIPWFVNNVLQYHYAQSRAVASRSKASRLGLALRNARWFESSWGKKFSHEISASVWDRCPPSIVMHLASYDR
ncbi:hypothetical protein ANN_16046 [Periplaneta americana]|uniref:MADF domain-containing protein n=1 Tax=Periplaneta americana TaxID=6978 RepID=A0ABQ8SHW5_PERAM|nr:hypothetical protein ANN_16046 [Periplaneta americana]